MNKVVCTRKTYITVIAYHELNGDCQPLYIYFSDGRKYHIDKVINQFKTTIDKFRGVYDTTFIVEINKKHGKIYIESNTGKWYVQEKIYSNQQF